jgi:transcriptional regulator with XRE-family HTH domain
MEEDFKVIIGDRLKYLRKSRKIRVQRIAEGVGVAPTTYTGWEIGHRAPNGEKLVKLADFFNTTVDFITGKTDKEDQPDIELLQETLKKVRLNSFGKPLSSEQAEALSEIVMKLLKD